MVDETIREISFAHPDIPGQQVMDTAYGCIQCGRCSAGCPAPLRNPSPALLLRLVQLGLVKDALNEKLLWACIGCRRCTNNCPRGLDVQFVIARLRRMASFRPPLWLPPGFGAWLNMG